MALIIGSCLVGAGLHDWTTVFGGFFLILFSSPCPFLEEFEKNRHVPTPHFFFMVIICWEAILSPGGLSKPLSLLGREVLRFYSNAPPSPFFAICSLVLSVWFWFPMPSHSYGQLAFLFFIPRWSSSLSPNSWLPASGPSLTSSSSLTRTQKHSYVCKL